MFANTSLYSWAKAHAHPLLNEGATWVYEGWSKRKGKGKGCKEGESNYRLGRMMRKTTVEQS